MHKPNIENFNIDLVAYMLSKGDITKMRIIYKMDLDDALEYFFLERLKILNDKIIQLAQMEKINAE